MSVGHLETPEQLDAALTGGRAVVLDFTATWCGPCKVYAPVFQAVAEATPSAAFFKVDVDEAPLLAQRFGVMSVPTTVVLAPDGSVKDRAVGAVPEHRLRALVG